MWFVEPIRGVQNRFRRPPERSEVRSRPLGWGLGQLPDLIELLSNREVLGEEGRLDSMEEALELAYELSLRNAMPTL